MNKTALLIALTLGALSSFAQENPNPADRDDRPGPPPGERQIDRERDRPDRVDRGDRADNEDRGFDAPDRLRRRPGGPGGPGGPLDRFDRGNRMDRGERGYGPRREQLRLRDGGGPEVCPECKRPYGPPPRARLGRSGPGFGPEGRGPGIGPRSRGDDRGPLPPGGEYRPRFGRGEAGHADFEPPDRAPRSDRPGPGPRGDRPGPRRPAPSEPDDR